MKRFVAFAYDNYYPNGAQGDFIGAFDSLEEATAAARLYGTFGGNQELDVLDTAGDMPIWHSYTSINNATMAPLGAWVKS